MEAGIVEICIGQKKGESKKPVEKAVFIEQFGIENDAHAGTQRQVSLLAQESIDRLGIVVEKGAFGENIITRGLPLDKVKIGTKFKTGKEVILEVTQIGKECHSPCRIAKQAGRCAMPSDGIFAKVIKGGIVKRGDGLKIINDKSLIKISLLVISDRASSGERPDETIPMFKKHIGDDDAYSLENHKIVPDDETEIKNGIRELAKLCNLLLTSGGTGFAPRDVTPEATASIIEKRADNITHYLMMENLKHTPFAPITRGICGSIGKTLVINLPGKPKSVIESFEILKGILPHAIKVLKGEVDGH